MHIYISIENVWSQQDCFVFLEIMTFIQKRHIKSIKSDIRY